ncbi:hypothetical protein M758_7G156300 [Ceratodon purpureus]|uniref:Uncharacterized protein n=1 Tax=Ceratodon purpureus TaxID=3225 RepID=A0A8T0H5P1_CERPU|nr:hypothetical protein KC19_7G122000 [Ceratodon purpureus]KAG0611661.1 hypothetical protein M758_7G156300 [Ceratodon purpureus]
MGRSKSRLRRQTPKCECVVERKKRMMKMMDGSSDIKAFKSKTHNTAPDLPRRQKGKVSRPSLCSLTAAFLTVPLRAACIIPRPEPATPRHGKFPPPRVSHRPHEVYAYPFDPPKPWT